MVARFAPPKLQSSVVRTLAQLLDVPWTMTFVGDGPQLDRCRSESRALIGDRARFVGRRDDVATLLSVSDVALLWSRYEGMPIALMEAMRTGLCCIGSDLPGVRELFGSPPAGIVASGEKELASAARSVIGDPTTRQALGADARRRYESAFTIDRMLRATDEVYAAVLARSRH
jgi:glycosyltransferase involved in cell wall biosynthesis